MQRLRASGRPRAYRSVRVGQSIGTALAGKVIQAAAFAIPFLLAGALQIAYDLGLYFGFRGRPAEHEIV
jgi:hypothetical protein